MKQPDPPLAPLRRGEPLSEKVYRAVHQKIASGALDPAQKLTETQLATLLGVSRTPVREALARLRREGLVDSGARRVVSTLTRADIEEIMEVRLLMEPYIAARAADRATPAGVQQLEAALADEERALPLKSPQKFSIANHAFRQGLMRLAGNGRLAEAASRYDASIQALRRATLARPEHRATVVKHHRALVEAIRAGAHEQAEAQMRQLMREASDCMLGLAPARRRSRA
ncbi:MULTISPECIES: GntR family transcriptional regulator [Ramlibacter]|nr:MULTISPECIES: GntR family transcriptional regulator [Ramlibacter]MBA2963279.1 GntR family transcriptional regulator [Ramlibacter sp. CGMCC 1.13660]